MKPMANDILDLETFYQVRKLTPAVAIAQQDLPKLVVEALEALTTDEVTKVRVMEICERISNVPANWIGRTLNKLGLVTWRGTRGQAYVAWTRQQVKILKKALAH